VKKVLTFLRGERGRRDWCPGGGRGSQDTSKAREEDIPYPRPQKVFFMEGSENAKKGKRAAYVC